MRRWAGAGESHSSLVKLVGDDHSLNLGRPLPDAVDAQLAEETLGDVLAHEAPAPENLYGSVGHAVGHLGCIELDHRTVRVLQLDVYLRVDLSSGCVGHEARGPQLGQRVGEHELD